MPSPDAIRDTFARTHMHGFNIKNKYKEIRGEEDENTASFQTTFYRRMKRVEKQKEDERFQKSAQFSNIYNQNPNRTLSLFTAFDS